MGGLNSSSSNSSNSNNISSSSSSSSSSCRRKQYREDADLAGLVLDAGGRRPRLRRRAALPERRVLVRQSQLPAVSLRYHRLLPAASTTALSPKSIQRVAAAAAAAEAAFSLPSPQTSDGNAVIENRPSERTLDADVDGAGNDPLIELEAFFQSPKCMDYMLNPCAFFAGSDQFTQECCDEDDEISLWSFC
uniref:Uncharacterized protein n=1 Tax=Ananas comosus var. bracteatus TaxID=296719 RepID=A0A6V7P8H2_ANACO|nr:unnamed protein product [Ananas comosus var. bracteatus]